MARIETGRVAAPEETPQVGDFVLPPLNPKKNVRAIPKVPVFPRFLFFYDPDRWHVHGDKIRPRLGKLKVQAGINGVEHDIGGGLDIANAIKRLEKQGRTLIDEQVDGRPYIAAYETAPDGVIQRTHLERWLKPVKGQKKARYGEAERREHMAFLDYLVDNGIVEPPAPHVVEGLLERAEREWTNLQKRVGANPGLQPRIDEVEGRLQVIRAWLDANGEEADPVEPDPIPKRSRKAKAPTDEEVTGE